jgi:drug/metabolite transporter (DMT)-like permease
MASEPRKDPTHVLGIVLIVASTAFFALAGIFTKATSADPWTIACWRGLFGALAIGTYVYVRRDRAHAGNSLRLGRRGWALAAVSAVSSVFFIAAFKYTYVANVAVIYATVPFMAAAIEWVAFRRSARLQTIATAVVSLIGVIIIVGGSVGGGHLFGDALAVIMTLGCAIYLIMVRAFQDTPVVWAAAVGAFLLFVTGWVTTDPLAISGHDFIVVAAFGLSFAAASILWTEGGRLLPASESGLLGAAEVPLAILFAWLILAEAPPVQSVGGGAIVLAAVFTHAGRDMLAQRKPTAALAAADHPEHIDEARRTPAA